MTASLAGGRRPLAGHAVVVTRPRERAAGLVAALRDAGAEVVELPVVETVAPPDGGAALEAALARLGEYRWVAFTSPTAVHRTMALVPDARAFGGLRLGAVGAGTAAALGEYRLVADLVPPRQSAAGLAEAFPPAELPGAKVLFPRAEGARPTLAFGLQAKGWTVDGIVAYRTVPVPPPDDAVLPSLALAAAVVFASPSAVEAYLGLRTRRGRPLPVPAVAACIGPTTAAAARRLGIAVGVEAPTPDTAVLVAGLEAAVQRRTAP